MKKDRRKVIWDIYQEYTILTEKEKILDESDLYLRLRKKIKSLSNFEPYSEVIIDEAQDLPPVALHLCTLLAGGGNTERLTLLADPSQSIYYKGIPCGWQDCYPPQLCQNTHQKLQEFTSHSGSCMGACETRH